MRTFVRTAALSLGMMLACARLAAAVDPADKCQALKNGAVGKYAACSEKARAKKILTGDDARYLQSQAKCKDKMTAAWDRREAAATSAGSMCPSMGDASDIGDYLDDCIKRIAEDLGGGDAVPDYATCAATLAQCTNNTQQCEDDVDAFVAEIGACMSNLEPCLQQRSQCLADYALCDGYPTGIFPLRTGDTVSRGAGSDGDLQRGTARSFSDNGDGTITDNVTGLMWEKKDDSGGLHDKDDRYAWCPGVPSYYCDDFSMTGTVTTSFLAALNAAGGFAGHTDWRLPNLNELETLRNLGGASLAVYAEFQSGCVPGCTVTTCSCTPAYFFWSSTSYAGFAGNAYGMDSYGIVHTDWKYRSLAVRAVRTAS